MTVSGYVNVPKHNETALMQAVSHTVSGWKGPVYCPCRCLCSLCGGWDSGLQGSPWLDLGSLSAMHALVA